MPPKRTSTYEEPAMTQATIRKLVTDSVTAALEAQAATMENADNTNRNTEESEAHVARKCELTLSSLDVVQGFSFFLQMGFTLILATLDGLDVCLLGDVIGEDDCNDDG
ncbi:hypothetical protein Tco_0887607 [Tanacetum coccineum]